jgi:biotin-(acetyl-CoA carboxylase) ligase
MDQNLSLPASSFQETLETISRNKLALQLLQNVSDRIEGAEQKYMEDSINEATYKK